MGCGPRASKYHPRTVTTVSDLDALVLRCHSERARSYIAESVVCLKAGACRAAIVVAWIAVVHDLIESFSRVPQPGFLVRLQREESAEMTMPTTQGDWPPFYRWLLDTGRVRKRGPNHPG